MFCSHLFTSAHSNPTAIQSNAIKVHILFSITSYLIPIFAVACTSLFSIPYSPFTPVLRSTRIDIVLANHPHRRMLLLFWLVLRSIAPLPVLRPRRPLVREHCVDLTILPSVFYTMYRVIGRHLKIVFTYPFKLLL